MSQRRVLSEQESIQRKRHEALKRLLTAEDWQQLQLLQYKLGQKQITSEYYAHEYRSIMEKYHSQLRQMVVEQTQQSQHNNSSNHSSSPPPLPTPIRVNRQEVVDLDQPSPPSTSPSPFSPSSPPTHQNGRFTNQINVNSSWAPISHEQMMTNERVAMEYSEVIGYILQMQQQLLKIATDDDKKEEVMYKSEKIRNFVSRAFLSSVMPDRHPNNQEFSNNVHRSPSPRFPNVSTKSNNDLNYEEVVY